MLFDLLQTVKAFGGLDILVSNAAVNPTYGPVLEAEGSTWDKVRGVGEGCGGVGGVGWEEGRGVGERRRGGRRGRRGVG